MTNTAAQTDALYRAAIATDAAIAGPHCTIDVYELEVTGHSDDGPVYELSDRTAMDTAATSVRTDDPDRAAAAQDEADEILRAAGWVRVEDWDAGDGGLYADVEPANG
ncbi:hypothetical protein [Micromonospora carbonacea]|uniref:hypothetical protein n=1 Tax=Micromonospora carbonacea TaxID=47853 RepID=UPI00371E4D67